MKLIRRFLGVAFPATCHQFTWTRLRRRSTPESATSCKDGTRILTVEWMHIDVVTVTVVGDAALGVASLTDGVGGGEGDESRGDEAVEPVLSRSSLLQQVHHVRRNCWRWRSCLWSSSSYFKYPSHASKCHLLQASNRGWFRSVSIVI